jgi:hypothetical protein
MHELVHELKCAIISRRFMWIQKQAPSEIYFLTAGIGSSPFLTCSRDSE